ncbi:hypothetical protein CISG_08365 [Coccidioides immitis RMSCC 3703]|uniref:Uncharacterized protein n=1 Tax=Coccidioides immitis RMSCC 3703 TaxID=454286 RepID=A0A0J8R567_COCIT|nr:hypothetical protein CISG_08365 [Coccidioides immitis RMSCC 3703]
MPRKPASIFQTTTTTRTSRSSKSMTSRSKGPFRQSPSAFNAFLSFFAGLRPSLLYFTDGWNVDDLTILDALSFSSGMPLSPFD